MMATVIRLDDMVMRLLKWVQKSPLTRAASAIFLVVVISGFSAYVAVTITGDQSLVINGDRNHVTIPRAPTVVTTQDIACKGKVDPPATARMNGYRATYSARDAENIVTLYSLVLTLDDRGNPKDAFSVVWDYGDGITDSRDRQEPLIVATDPHSVECLLKAAR